MKIVTLATRFSTGGAQLNSLLLADELSKRGHSCESWFLMRAGDLQTPQGLRVRVISDSPRQTAFNTIFCLVKTLWCIVKSRPDFIIGFHPLANIIGALCAAITPGTRFVATQRNPSDSQGAITRWLEALVGSSRLYFSNIAVTSAVARSYDAYTAAYRRKINIVHNGTPRLPSICGDRNLAREKLGLPCNATIVGSLGRLAEQKNPLFLLDVAAQLPPHIHLALAGDGPLRPEIEGLAEALGIRSRLHMLGELHGENVARFYRSIDVFLLPSRFEGFGRTLVEAMDQRTPIIANALPVTREVVGDAGILLPLDARQWASAIENLAEDSAKCSQLSAEGFEQSLRFSIASMVDGYERLLAAPQASDA